MTHGEMVGEVVGHLQNSDQLPISLLEQQLWQASVSLYRRMRASSHFRPRLKTIPLRNGVDVYECGEEVADILYLECLTDGSGSTGSAQRVVRFDLAGADNDWDEGPALEYELIGEGKIRLLQMPTTDTVPGTSLRLRFRPKPIRMTAPGQTPDFPEATHESIVIAAVERLLLREGVALANPQAFQSFRARSDKELDGYLIPSAEDGRPQASDRLGIYSSEEAW